MHPSSFLVDSLIWNDPAVRVSQLPESLIHDIWRHQEFDNGTLKSVSGDPIVVHHPGESNPDTGPDFLNARVRIDSTLWIGDVEIHRTSGEWFQHGHHNDPRYNSVVLHVSLGRDLWTGSVVRADGTTTPELVLGPFLRERLRVLLVRFRRNNSESIICSQEWSRVPDAILEPWIRHLSAVRLRRRSEEIRQAHSRTGDPDELLYRRFLRALGYAKNQDAMHELAQRVPLSVVRSVETSIDREALLLGTAGLLTDVESPGRYITKLRERHATLSKRYGIEPMRRLSWRWFRLRPANFPELRIAQAAAALSHQLFAHPGTTDRLRSHIGDGTAGALRLMRDALSSPPDEFWTRHYRIDKESRPHRSTMGPPRVNHVVVNAFVPTVLAVEADHADETVVRQLVEFLESLPPESDEVVRLYESLGTRPESVSTTQGLHELNQWYCSRHGCLRCQVGRFILHRDRIDYDGTP